MPPKAAAGGKAAGNDRYALTPQGREALLRKLEFSMALYDDAKSKGKKVKQQRAELELAEDFKETRMFLESVIKANQLQISKMKKEGKSGDENKLIFELFGDDGAEALEKLEGVARGMTLDKYDENRVNTLDQIAAVGGPLYAKLNKDREEGRRREAAAKPVRRMTLTEALPTGVNFTAGEAVEGVTSSPKHANHHFCQHDYDDDTGYCKLCGEKAPMPEGSKDAENKDGVARGRVGKLQSNEKLAKNLAKFTTPPRVLEALGKPPSQDGMKSAAESWGLILNEEEEAAPDKPVEEIVVDAIATSAVLGAAAVIQEEKGDNESAAATYREVWRRLGVAVDAMNQFKAAGAESIDEAQLLRDKVELERLMEQTREHADFLDPEDPEMPREEDCKIEPLGRKLAIHEDPRLIKKFAELGNVLDMTGVLFAPGPFGFALIAQSDVGMLLQLTIEELEKWDKWWIIVLDMTSDVMSASVVAGINVATWAVTTVISKLGPKKVVVGPKAPPPPMP